MVPNEDLMLDVTLNCSYCNAIALINAVNSCKACARTTRTFISAGYTGVACGSCSAGMLSKAIAFLPRFSAYALTWKLEYLFLPSIRLEMHPVRSLIRKLGLCRNLAEFYYQVLPDLRASALSLKH